MWHTVQSSVSSDGIMTYCLQEKSMNLQFAMGPLLSLIAGILILAVPRLLNYIVAIYLIVVGLIGLFGSGVFR
jgi:hypothetical protein